MNVKLFTSLLLSVLEDLSNWRDTIFIKQQTNDIHYLDSSLLNSCLQIENILDDKELDSDENDLELF
jgi:two-component system chemotaxis response regulator CheY